MSDNCFDPIRKIVHAEVSDVIRIAMIVNDEHITKTLMVDDIYEAIRFRGTNLTPSTNIGSSVCDK